MTVEQIQSALMKLSLDERREFVHWFYDHEAEILDCDEDDLDELSPEWKAELLRRAKEMEDYPSLAVPITVEYFDNLRKKIAALRDSKT